MYPWQSGSNGDELTPTVHLNPRSGRWIPDNSRLQRHINAAIAYDVWLYHQATNDIEFLPSTGPRCSSRSLASGRASPPTTRPGTAT